MDKTTKKLFKKKNVVAVVVPGPGKEGKKYTLGLNTGRDAVIVGVIKKVPMSQLAKKDQVPDKIKGMETDVWELGKITLQNDLADRVKKWRPAPGGVSVGHKDITAGTLSMIVKKNGERYILSNNHVLANLNNAEIGDDILQPGPYHVLPEMGDCRLTKLAEFVWMNKISLSDCSFSHGVVKFLNFWHWLFGKKTRIPPPIVEQFEANLVDCAIAGPVSLEEASDDILEIGKPMGFDEPYVGMKLKKSGARTGFTYGECTAIGATVNVGLDQSGLEFAIFEDQGIAGAMSDAGDSGSAIFKDSDENLVVGLLFAGSAQATIFNRFSNVMVELELDPF